MNNFPAMTEAQRQLAALCKIEIKRWQAASESNPNMRYMAELMEIALAALTAKPRGYIDAGTPSDEINILTENKILKTDIALYTAPPAPVLRPIELPKAIQQHETFKYGLESSDAYGLHWGSKETLSQCIKAIRAAGYEVKQ